jgi:hypothetical protein
VGAAADPRGHHRRSADRRAGPRGSAKRPEGAIFASARTMMAANVGSGAPINK